MTAPVIRSHGNCETAKGTDCTCRCRGAGHALDVLRQVVLANGSVSPGLAGQLEELFGSAFTSITAPPNPGEVVRRGGWKPIRGSSFQTGKLASQVEQRIVDVVARDVLAGVAVHPVSSKQNWIGAINELGMAHWPRVDAVINVPTTAESGHLWASLMAATSRELATAQGAQSYLTGNTGRLQSEIEALLSTDRMYRVAFPRVRPTTYRSVGELSDPLVQKAASGAVATALNTLRRAGTSIDDARFLVQLMGVVTCRDLWKHPAAVRFCVLPALGWLRRSPTSPGVRFSLDTALIRTERHIHDQLVSGKWDLHGHW
jgi:hypothetical protein